MMNSTKESDSSNHRISSMPTEENIGILLDFNTEILLIEDNPYDADLVYRTLKRSRLYQPILWLKDGTEVIKILELSEQVGQHIRLVVLDLKLPKKSGIEILEEIRKNTTLKHVPIVVLTSSNMDSDIRRCYELGVNSYVVKPVDFEEYSRVIIHLFIYWLDINHLPHYRIRIS